MILKIIFIQSCIFLYIVDCQNEKDQPALFYRKTTTKKHRGIKTQGNDSKVEDILNWLQSRYKEVNKNRKTREEDPSRAYLPSLSSSSTQAPRPFQTQNQYTSISPQYSSQSFLDQNQYSSESSQYSSKSSQYSSESSQYTSESSESSQYTTVSPLIDEHPPHIHDIQVVCSKDKMDVYIEFSSIFNGVVYSKGYYNNNDCIHVKSGSNQLKYNFILYLNTCGTQFVEGLSSGISSYLENSLVIQNEPGILEVWDVVRNVRCLWEGNIDQYIKTDLTISQLNQELVTFSGDTGVAKLEIQNGRGPYLTPNSNLVMIGDLMTLVIRIDGDIDFNLRIGQCIGTDNTNTVQLTDNNGCPLKIKLMGGFIYERHQQTNAAIAYAYFKAFKFPDVMDLTIECNVQLCKTNCRPPCEDPNQKYEPTRRKRSIFNDTTIINDNLNDEMTKLVQTIRVILPDELPPMRNNNQPEQPIQPELPERAYYYNQNQRVCLSTKAFYASTFALAGLGLLSGIIAIFYWAKSQKIRK